MIKSHFFLFAFWVCFLFSGNLSAQSETETPQNSVYPDTNRVYWSLREANLFPEYVFFLDLSRKRLDSIPAEIFQFVNLRELNLSRNKIESLPEDISKLKKLEKLDLSNNNLASLPNEISALVELKFLGLNRNVIDTLPPGIGGLRSLERLELWDNELRDVPDEISELKNLKVLELRGILFSDEQQARIDELVVKSAKIFMSPSCNCSY